MNSNQQNETPKSVDFAAEADEACLRLEHIGKAMQDLAAHQRARASSQKNWLALRDATLLMSSLAHILSEFARVYWRMIPADLRTAPIPADSCLSFVEVVR